MTYDYAVTSANCTVEIVKLIISFVALTQVWRAEGITEDNRLSSSWDELHVYPIPAALYLVKNLLQYYIFYWTTAPSYQVLKNLNIISTGVLYRVFLQRKLSGVHGQLLCSLDSGARLHNLILEAMQSSLRLLWDYSSPLPWPFSLEPRGCTLSSS